MSIVVKVYNKIPNRIRNKIDPHFRNNQDGFHRARNCAQKIHVLRRIIEGFQDYQLPLHVTFIDFKKTLNSINRKVMFAILCHYGIPESIVTAINVLYNDSEGAVKSCPGLHPIYNTNGLALEESHNRQQ